MLSRFREYLKAEGKSTNTIEGYIRGVNDYSLWFSGTYGKEVVKLIEPNVKEYISHLQTVKHQDGKIRAYSCGFAAFYG